MILFFPLGIGIKPILMVMNSIKLLLNCFGASVRLVSIVVLCFFV